MKLRLAVYKASEDWRKQYTYVGGFKDGLAWVKRDDKWGYVNEQGEVVVPLKYDQAEDFHNGFGEVKLKDKYGFVNTAGDEVVEPKYNHVQGFNKGFAIVWLNNKSGLIDTKGEEVLSINYTYEQMKEIFFVINEMIKNSKAEPTAQPS